MSGFWDAPTGEKITGDEKSSFVPDFTVVPEGTTAISTIKSAKVVNKEATQYAGEDKFIELTHKLIDGDFKGREVSQKIKVFLGKPEAITRNLNMLKRVMDLCNYKPTHNNEPTDADLSNLVGKVVGIKVGEWSMPKKDGGFMEGNHVREVHASANFKCETGTKAEIVHTRDNNESAFSRNPVAGNDVDLDEELPF